MSCLITSNVISKFDSPRSWNILLRWPTPGQFQILQVGIHLSQIDEILDGEGMIGTRIIPNCERPGFGGEALSYQEIDLAEVAGQNGEPDVNKFLPQ